MPISSQPKTNATDASTSARVVYLSINAEDAGQRLDNYLLRVYKGVPKSHLYRILRSGELRVNSCRANAGYRLQVGDRLRIPPLRLPHRQPKPIERAESYVQLPVFHEDAALLVVDKPAGLAVHGGSGVSFGVIELLRRQRPQSRFLELAHRLDRGTSGVLLLAKKRSVLSALHAAFRGEDATLDKRYWLLVRGSWREPLRHVRASLVKTINASGQRHVHIATGRAGEAPPQTAHTVLRLLTNWSDYSLLEAQLKTGRTHQIRVHLSHLGYPILGDEKYGDFALNKQLSGQCLKRMALHACKLQFKHPQSGEVMRFHSSMPTKLSHFINHLGPCVQGKEKLKEVLNAQSCQADVHE